MSGDYWTRSGAFSTSDAAVSWQLLREGDVGDDGTCVDVDDDVEQRESTDDDPVKILCDTCRHELTTASARTTVDGAHRHVKVNPHGNVYHIACFSPVPGIAAIGSPSAQFSWFSGYRWQIALCAGCQVHVGWQFSGDGGFGALIEGRFIEESEE